MALSNKQRMFILEYVKDWNATQAAIRAGYSEQTAYSQGSRLLKDVEISKAIDEHIMSAEEAANILTDIARGDMADLMDFTTAGYVTELTEVDQETGKLRPKKNTKLIRKIKQKVTIITPSNGQGEDKEIVDTEFELYSAHEAARDILKYRGKLVDKTEVSGPDGGAIPVELFGGALKKVYGTDSNK